MDLASLLPWSGPRLFCKQYVVATAREAIDAAITEFIDSKRTDGRSRKTLVKYEGELRNFAAYAAGRHAVLTMPRLTVKLFDAYKAHRRDVDGRVPWSAWRRVEARQSA